jgi:hypothetical protein
MDLAAARRTEFQAGRFGQCRGDVVELRFLGITLFARTARTVADLFHDAHVTLFG